MKGAGTLQTVERCPDKDYCIPDECEHLGTKSTPKHGNAKGRIEKYPFKVYHIRLSQRNGNNDRVKITVDKAVELEQSEDLYQSIVGAPVKERKTG